MMLQLEIPEDFVIATGITHSVKDLLELAFGYLELDYRKYLVQDKDLYRPSEIHTLQGDASKAHRKLNWYPQSTIQELMKEMVDSDLERFSK